MFRSTYLLLVAIGIFSVIGCGGGEVTPSSNVNTSFSAEMFVKEDNTQCFIKATVRQPTTNLDLVVRASAEAGILFDNNTSASDPVETKLFAGEIRIIHFNCRLDPQHAWLSGQHIIQLSALHKHDGSIFSLQTVQAHVVASTETSPVLVPDLTAFALAIGVDFQPGSLHTAYGAKLNENRDSGTLFLKVISPYNDYSPKLMLDTMGGTTFDATSDGRISATYTLDNMRQNAVRILEIPFWVDTNSIEGRYSFRTSIQVKDALFAEFAPIVVIFYGTDTDAILGMSTAPITKPHENCCESSGRQIVTVPTSQPVEIVQIVWQSRLTNFDGDLLSLYFDSGLVDQSIISWEQFINQVHIYNPHLMHDDYVFYANKTYLLPERVIKMR